MKQLSSRFPHDRLWIALLFVIASLSLFPLLGAAPLFDEDEGFYAEASREMLEKGDYLTAHFNGAPQYDKPILIYWLQALSFKIFGLNEFAARFPSALATFLWMLAIFGFTRRHLGPQCGILSALFFISAVQITITGKAAIVDSALNLFITQCLFHIYEYTQNRQNRKLYWAALFVGLAFLAKGPVAIVIPFGISLIYCLLKKEFRLWLRMVFSLPAILIFALVALPWYVLEYMNQGAVFLQDFFLKHNLERYSRAFEDHSGSFFYYIPVLIVGTLPHCGLLLTLIRRAGSLWKKEVYRFCFVWIGFVLILFSFGGTKLPHYILSAFPPLFILFGGVYERLESLRSYIAPAAVFLALFLIFPLALPLVIPYVQDRFAVCVMISGRPLFGTDYTLFCGLLTGVVALLFFIRQPASLKHAVVVSIAYLLLINLALMPRIGTLMQSPVREAALIAGRLPGPVVMWGHYLPSFAFYSRKFVALRTPASGDVLITKKTRLSEAGPHEILYEKNCIVLARILN
ncbi:MAG: glycosyltransferase family 39 protein [Deltaproteobacteria bacterium]|nr:glycosyltransferase family 39 protein [Deltaproteobacteria bacterium]